MSSVLNFSSGDFDYDGGPIVAPGRMTEEEFVAWCPSDVKAEWVDGEVIIMSPANFDHCDLILWLGRLMGDFVDHHDLGVVVGPEFTVRLAPQRRRRVPDLLFIHKSRLGLLRRNHLEGAPDLAIEIVSPESVARDWREKYADYEAAGVREYWVIDPQSRRVEAYANGEDGRFRILPETDGVIRSTVLSGFDLRVEWLWAEGRVKVRAALHEMGIV